MGVPPAELARQYPLVKLELSVATGATMLEQTQAGRRQLVLGIATILTNTLQSPQLRFVEAGILPELPTVEIGLGRRPGTEAERTVDALEALIRNVLG